MSLRRCPVLRINLVTVKSVIWISTLPILGAVCALCMVQVYRTEKAELRALSAEVSLTACREKNVTDTVVDIRLRSCVQGYYSLQNEISTFLRMARYEQQ